MAEKGLVATRAVGAMAVVFLPVLFMAVRGVPAAHAADCPPPDAPPRVILETGFTQPRLDTSKSPHQLAAILASQRESSAVGNAVGLTSTNPSYSYRTRISARQVGGQRYCAYLTDLTIRFRYEDVRVYVANKYESDSCPYQVTLDHELRHVALYRRGYEAFLPRLSARAEEVARRLNPMRASSVGMARRVHLDRVQAELEPLFQAFFDEQRAKNLEMDTPEAYGRERDKCRTW